MSEFITQREALLLQAESRLLALRDHADPAIRELVELLLVQWSVISVLNSKATTEREHAEARTRRPAERVERPGGFTRPFRPGEVEEISLGDGPHGPVVNPRYGPR